MVVVQLQQIDVPPGQKIRLHDISSSELEKILNELGERRATRIAYREGTLEIMTPLPEHEYDKEIIGDLIKAILEEKGIEFISLGSTTFKNSEMSRAIEPDQCFYIRNEARVRGKKRLDLSIDPPPDLAIEIDITSRTHREIYAALGIEELWRKEGDAMEINILDRGQYIQVSRSRIFPDIEMERLLQALAQSRVSGRNKALKAFRAWLNE